MQTHEKLNIFFLNIILFKEGNCPIKILVAASLLACGAEVELKGGVVDVEVRRTERSGRNSD